MIIETLEELEKHFSESVTITGIYKQINGAKRPGTYAPSGRACIILSDNHSVAINTQSSGIRPKEELEQMEGKKVTVRGLFMGRQTLWGDGTQASIVSNALLGVSEVKLVE
jgi:hypothetical protein